MNALKENFPDWGEALDEMQGNVSEFVDKRLGGVVTEERASELIDERVNGLGRGINQETLGMARKLVRIDIAHEGWEETIKEDDFEPWLNDQTAEVRDYYASDKPGDVIKMLDLYKKRNEEVELDLTDPDPADETTQSRLRKSVPATGRGTRTPQQRQPTEEEDFQAAFDES
jgi:hypothetical protein